MPFRSLASRLEPTLPFVSLALLVALFFDLGPPAAPAALATGFDASAFGAVLAGFIALALVIERAVEVLLLPFFRPAELALAAPMAAADARVTALEHSEQTALARRVTSAERLDVFGGEVGTAFVAAAATRADMRADHAAAAQRLRATKAQWASLALVVLSAGVSLVGFGLLAQLGVAMGMNAPDPQGSFRRVDLVVTTLCLAGGAHGLHDIVGRLGVLTSPATAPATTVSRGT